METQTYIIEFEGVSTAEANRYAEELKDALLGAAPEVEVKQKRADADAQDFGATLVLILGTQFAVVVANAFRDWINRRNNAKVSIKTPDGEILLENISAKDVLKVTELLKTQR